MISLDSKKSINSIAPAFDQKPVSRKRKDRFEFPIPRSSFENLALSTPPSFLTQYTKTLWTNLNNRSPNAVIPMTPNPPKPWEIQGPLRVVAPAEIEDNYNLNPMDIYQNILLIAIKNQFFGYCSKELTQQFITKTEPESYFRSIKANSHFPVVATRINAKILRFLDIEKKCTISNQNLTEISEGLATDNAPMPITWRTAFEMSTSFGNHCVHYDYRHNKPFKLDLDALATSSTSRIVGMAWSSDGNLLATGGIDGETQIYDIRNTGKSLMNYKHNTAMVKALSWNPSVNILASGGGSSDRHLRITNITNNALISNFYTGAQISTLAWLDKQHLIAGFGFLSANKKLEAYKINDNSIAVIPHPQHPLAESRRILAVVKDPEVNMRYYTLSAVEGQICQWGLPEEDPSKAKDLSLR